MSRPTDLPPVRSPRRVVLAVVFGIWGVTLAVLLLTGGISRYLAPRNLPFVALAAPVLLVVAVTIWARSVVPHHGDPTDDMHELSCVCRWEEAPRRTDLVTTSLMLLPLVVLAIVPSGTLGASAARSRGVQTIALRAPRSQPQQSSSNTSDVREVTILDIVYASTSSGYADQIGITSGSSTVRMIGLAVKGRGAPEDGFLLTRFLVTCCVADAVPIAVRVRGPGASAVRDNTWVSVKGPISWTAAAPGAMATDVQADLRLEQVKTVPEPVDPYLY